MNEIEEQKQKYIKFAKWGIGLLAVAVLAPVAWLAVSGMVGVGLALAIALVGVNAGPVLAEKLANAKYRALDAEAVAHVEKVTSAAAENPIETMQLQLIQKQKDATKFSESLTIFRTEIKNFSDQIDVFGKDYAEEVPKYKETLAIMQNRLKVREARYQDVQDAIKLFEDGIKKMKALWKMALAAQKMNQVAGMEVKDPFAKIKEDSAIDSVMNSLNKAFAEMETSMLDNKEIQQARQAQLANNATPVPAVILNVEKVGA